MSIVSAYTDLGAWEKSVPGLYAPGTKYLLGELEAKTGEGLEVGWGYGETPPDSAQVYVYWEPTVIAVWEGVTETEHGDEVTNNEQGVESGEDREDADGSNPVERDEEVSAEPDLGTGEGGEGYVEVPAAGTAESEAVEGDSA